MKGNPVARLLGQPTGPYTPLTLAPGQTGTITVTITPDAAASTVIHGFLYVDAVNANSRTFGSITGSGDELIAIPYTYTAGREADEIAALTAMRDLISRVDRDKADPNALQQFRSTLAALAMEPARFAS